MVEQMKNFTVDMVKELENLGVTFENTSDVWELKNDEYFLGKSSKDDYIYQDTIFNDKKFLVKAPNLLDILNILPKQFVISDTCIGVLEIDFIANAVYYFNGLAANDRRENRLSNSIVIRNENILPALFKLIKWLLKNHPNQIINK